MLRKLNDGRNRYRDRLIALVAGAFVLLMLAFGLLPLGAMAAPSVDSAACPQEPLFFGANAATSVDGNLAPMPVDGSTANPGDTVTAVYHDETKLLDNGVTPGPVHLFKFTLTKPDATIVDLAPTFTPNFPAAGSLKPGTGFDTLGLGRAWRPKPRTGDPHPDQEFDHVTRISAIIPTSFTAPGTYTANLFTRDGDNTNTGGDCSSLTWHFTIGLGSPSLSTVATPTSIVVGQQATISDTATVHGGIAPVTGIVHFHLYTGLCTVGVPDAIGDAPIDANGVATFTTTWTPTVAGTYQWSARYLGDANNQPFNTCGGTHETLIVTPRTPSITTVASGANLVVGTPATVGDTATFTGALDPTGVVSFTLFNADCSVSTGVTGTGPITTVAGVTSATFSTGWTPVAAGTYSWIASYAGDGNNAAFTTGCHDDNEQLTVAIRTPSITTVASGANLVVGTAGTVGDTARFVGAFAPTGVVSFTLFNSDCSVSTGVTGTGPITTVGGVSTATFSTSWTPAAAGTYSWIASYAGDANNAAFTTGCHDANEQLTVAKRTPSITTVASGANLVVGTAGTIGDTATFVGALAPTGVVSFTLYNADCSASTGVTGASTISTVGGVSSATFTISWTPAAAGTYSWIAKYVGDANNAAVITGCHDANEQLTVTSPPGGGVNPVGGVLAASTGGLNPSTGHSDLARSLMLALVMVLVGTAVFLGSVVYQPIRNRLS